MMKYPLRYILHNLDPLMIISNFHFSTDYMPENITYALADYPHYNLLPVYGMLCLSEQEFWKTQHGTL